MEETISQETIDKLLKEVYFKNCQDYFYNFKNIKNSFNTFFKMLQNEHFEKKLDSILYDNSQIYYEILKLILNNVLKPIFQLNFVHNGRAKVKERLEKYPKVELNYLVIKKIIENVFETATNTEYDKYKIEDIFKNLYNYDLQNKAFVDSVFLIFNIVSKDYIDKLFNNINYKYKASFQIADGKKLFNEERLMLKNIHFNFEGTDILSIFENLINNILKKISELCGYGLYKECELDYIIGSKNFLEYAFTEIQKFVLSYLINVIYNMFKNVEIENIENVKYN